VGGDGTFQALANASFGSDVFLGILPVGGGNDFASALGIPTRLQAALNAMLDYAPRRVDLVRVKTADGKTRLYVGGGGIGLDAEAAYLASGAYRHLPGRLRYVAAALRALTRFQRLRVRIDFPETSLQSEEADCLLTCALNTPTYGGGLRLAPGARVDDALLNVSLVEPLGATGVLRLLPGLLRTGELHTSRIRRWQVKRVQVTADRPCSFHGDGEIFGPAPLQIEVVPQAVQVLAPSPQ
jgi:diacylglycerol kinase (ATP)